MAMLDVGSPEWAGGYIFAGADLIIQDTSTIPRHITNKSR